MRDGLPTGELTTAASYDGGLGTHVPILSTPPTFGVCKARTGTPIGERISAVDAGGATRDDMAPGDGTGRGTRAPSLTWGQGRQGRHSNRSSRDESLASLTWVQRPLNRSPVLRGHLDRRRSLSTFERLRGLLLRCRRWFGRKLTAMLMPDRIPVRLQVQARPDEDDRRIVPAVLASGRLGARFGRRRFFLAGHIVFVTGSLMAAAAAAAGLQPSAIGLGALVFAIIEGTDLGWWRPLQDFSVLGLTWPATRPISIVFVLPLFRINALGLGVLHAGFVLAGMALGEVGS